MEELLRKQVEHLARIIGLMENDRLMQTTQTYDEHQALRNDNQVAKKLDEISTSINTFFRRDVSDLDNRHVVGAIVDLQEETSKTAKATSKEHLAALKKIQDAVSKGNEYKAIAERAQGQPIFRSIGDKFRDIKESFVARKASITGAINPTNYFKNTMAAISPRYRDREEYIQNERNLGSRKAEKTLKADYNTRSQMLQRNVKNEALLTRSRGSLTEEEFLKGNSKVAQQYLKEKEAVGKGLKKTDSRYTIDEKVAAREEKASVRLANKFNRTTNDINASATTRAQSIPTLANVNLETDNKKPKAVSKEDILESNRATGDYQKSQLQNAKDQKDILTDQLKVQRDILKIVTAISGKTTSSGNGIMDTLAAGAGAVGVGAAAAGAGSLIGKAGSAIKKVGSVASKLAGAAAVPLAVGAAGAAAAYYAADKFQESFGEGGFDLVKKLQDDKVIDYNATIMGYNPSEILDWKAIEALPSKDLKVLLDSGVEFSKEDTSKLHELFSKKMITGDKATIETPQDSSLLNNGQPIKAPVTPETIKPTQAESIYNKSGENATPSVAGTSSNVINAPTINNSSNTTQNNIIRLPVRNQDNTLQKYVSSRYSNQ